MTFSNPIPYSSPCLKPIDPSLTRDCIHHLIAITPSHHIGELHGDVSWELLPHRAPISNIFPVINILFGGNLYSGLLFTNSSKSCAVATPMTNLRLSSVMTAKSCVHSPSDTPPRKKASSSSSGVSIVMTWYVRPRRWKRVMAAERGSSGLTLPESRRDCKLGIEMYPSSARVWESTIVRCV